MNEQNNMVVVEEDDNQFVNPRAAQLTSGAISSMTMKKTPFELDIIQEEQPLEDEFN